MKTQEKLTNLQIELLKLFSFEVDEKQLVEIRQLLSDYFAQQATTEMDRLWNENNWSDDTMKKWANTHLRKKAMPK